MKEEDKDLFTTEAPRLGEGSRETSSRVFSYR